MTDPSEEAAYIEKLYEYGEQLSNANDKSQVRLFLFLTPLDYFFLRVLVCDPQSLQLGIGFNFHAWFLQNVKDYQGIIDAAKTSVKAKQLAAQLIPRFFKFFPDLSGPALDAHLDLVEEEELGVGIPLSQTYICYVISVLLVIF